MNAADAFQAGAFVLVVALLVKPVGAYLEGVFERRQTFLDPLLLPVERLIHRLVGIDPKRAMDWKRYSLVAKLTAVFAARSGVIGVVRPICHGRARAGVSGPLRRSIPATTQSRRHAF